LHMAQLMPLPLTVSCFSKIQIGFTFLVLAHLGSPGKGPLNGCVCVWKGRSCTQTKVNGRSMKQVLCSAVYANAAAAAVAAAALLHISKKHMSVGHSSVIL